MDPQSLCELLGDKLEDAKYGLLCLKEDPSTYKYSVKDAYDHRLEHVRDGEGTQHPRARNVGDTLLWQSAAVSDALMWPIVRLDNWSSIAALAKKQNDLARKYEDDIEVCKRLPRDYEEGFLLLLGHIVSSSEVICRQLQSGISASPGLRKFFMRQNSRIIELEGHIREKPSPIDRTREEPGWYKLSIA
ncbi:Uu.00g085550.m01.CDS01 [Anthostomella pinea]|uniref:Uu.00g085550.m01.CDS01 n=1 Tax=Anthostomella pinea TaxID=933095 RepID=A0AAI8VM01_9PEZI|nr:Uu.00g085550.m01.CDS01 [Anthostomella pinea]